MDLSTKIDYLYTAIIIEPREHKALSFVLHNFLKNLSNEWQILIFHGNKNIDYVKNIVINLDDEYKPRIMPVVNMLVDNLNGTTYSDFFKNAKFYDNIPTETFLIFQTDSMILSKNKLLINDFLDYDYVGAPWNCNNRVGNGGLSLRKKSKMLEIIHKKGYALGYEDIYFTHDISIISDYKIPDYKKAMEFSIETMYNTTSFGIHNCWKYLKKNELRELIKNYNEIQELIDLQ